MKREHEKTHDEVVKFYFKNFPNAKQDSNEAYGDFYIKHCDSLVGCEVYVPEQPLSLSNKRLVGETKKIEFSDTGVYIGESAGGGLSPNRFKEAVERAFVQKANQFSNKVRYKKVLIVYLAAGIFTDLDNFGIENQDTASIHISPFCSAIYFIGAFKKNRVINKNAKFKLTQSEIKFLDEYILHK